MDRQPQTPQDPAQRNPPVDDCSGPQPRPDAKTQGRPTLRIGPIFVRTLLHFFPLFNQWLDAVRDGRDPDRVKYHPRFLLWIGVFLFVCKLGSRRQIDYDLGDIGTDVLANLNRLAGTDQTTMPVNQTVDNYL